MHRKSYTGEMDKQRTRARGSWRGAEKAQVADVYKTLDGGEFIGRETLEAPVEVRTIIVNKVPVELVESGAAELVFPQTPFYAESGGQVADTGLLLTSDTHERVALVEWIYKSTPT